jgi:hypothetical protein
VGLEIPVLLEDLHSATVGLQASLVGIKICVGCKYSVEDIWPIGSEMYESGLSAEP